MTALSIRPRGVVLLLAAGLCTLAFSAAAQAPDRSSDVYQDWLLNCAAQRTTGAPADNKAEKDKKEAAAKPICEIVQTFRDRTNNQVVAIVAIGKPDPKTDRKILVQAPVGVWLPDGVTITADKANVVGQFLRCTQTACIAQADAKKEIVDALRAGTQTALEFSDASRARARLTISTKGFADALAALDKRS